MPLDLVRLAREAIAVQQQRQSAQGPERHTFVLQVCDEQGVEHFGPILVHADSTYLREVAGEVGAACPAGVAGALAEVQTKGDTTSALRASCSSCSTTAWRMLASSPAR